MTDQIMEGVTEYCEGYEVKLSTDEETGRLVVLAFNEAMHNATCVDMLQLIAWVRANRPDLLDE